MDNLLRLFLYLKVHTKVSRLTILHSIPVISLIISSFGQF